MMIGPFKRLEQCPRGVLIVMTLGIVFAVGVGDYFTGFELSFSVFYLLAVLMATWFVGANFAVFVSFLSIGSWLIGDLAAGAVYAHPLTLVWNALIVLAFYLAIVWLLANLKRLRQELEARVRSRTMELMNEMGERERLENEIWEIGEKERQRIGQDLHDSLCQHLTATALASQALVDRLAVSDPHEVLAAGRIVELVEEAVDLTRRVARGLYPVELDSDDLLFALNELARSSTSLYGIECTLDNRFPGMIANSFVATHVYLIAQEAITNAVRHGNATRCLITLANQESDLVLTIRDNGVGLSATASKSKGLGLRIMTHRAAMIGATLEIRNQGDGTVVSCVVKDAVAIPSQNESLHKVEAT